MTIRQVGGPLIIDTEAYGECVFTREEAPGAIANGTMIRKADSEPGDATPAGSIGMVVGSLAAPASDLSDNELAQMAPRFRDSKIAYFIEWANRPNEVVGIIDKKIEEVT